MEASALQAPAALAQARALRAPLLRLRSDEQLVALFRAGHDDAFRVIHDRYRQRLFAYTRQMLPRRQDAEDALQDVFVRAYAGLRASNRQLALRSWLYRVAHNRCIDELRRPHPPQAAVMELVCSPIGDPIAQADQRELLRRLVEDIRRLPDQQRSALLMRELGGMPYADMATVLEISTPAVKSLLVRARVALVQALEARETACSEIREALALAHDRGVRASATARRHMRDCEGCREFRRELRGVSRHLAALAPTLGPLGALAHVLGIGGSASSGAAAGGGTAAAGTAAAGGVAAGGGATSAALGTVGALATGAGHVATLLAATVVTAGGAVEIQHAIAARSPDRSYVRAVPEMTEVSSPFTHPTAPVIASASLATPLHVSVPVFSLPPLPRMGNPLSTVATSTSSVTGAGQLDGSATTSATPNGATTAVTVPASPSPPGGGHSGGDAVANTAGATTGTAGSVSGDPGAATSGPGAATTGAPGSGAPDQTGSIGPEAPTGTGASGAFTTAPGTGSGSSGSTDRSG